MFSRECLVVLSGGQDSTTALGWAKHKFKNVHAITFNYNQRHSRELLSAKKIAEMCEVESYEVIDIGGGVLKGTSPLTDKTKEVGKYKDVASLPKALEPTFVPARNTLFAAIAANRAYVMGIKNIVMGISSVDSAHYYDTTPKAVKAIQEGLRQSVFNGDAWFSLLTPLQYLSKANTVRLSKSVGVFPLLRYTTSCYEGVFPPCRHCHSCLLREKGFEEAGESDPLLLCTTDPLIEGEK